MKLRKRKRMWKDSGGNLVVIITMILALVLMLFVTGWGLKRNRSEHVQEEIMSISRVQVKLLKLEIEEQYKPLQTLASYMEMTGRTFEEEELGMIASVLRSVNRLCTIGYADQNGDVINYQGEKMGNISDRDYFQEIITGNCEEFCSYLATTKAVNEPRVLFSVPVYQDGIVAGVLFESKEIAVLENALFLDQFFDENASSFLADSEGHIIASNREIEEEELDRQLMKHSEKENAEELSLQESIRTLIGDGQETWYANIEEYISCMPIAMNDWYLLNIVDQDSITLQYHESEQVLIRLVWFHMVVLFGTVTLIVIFLSFRRKRAEIEADSFKNQYESYKALLYEMNCTIVEYDTQKDQLEPHRIFSSIKKGEAPLCFSDLTEMLQKRHPEFNVNELILQKQTAIRECRSTILESVFSMEPEEIRWYKIVLLPIQDLSGKVTEIYAAVWDTTEYHKEFEDATRFMEMVPGGMHRCYLNDPIHLEYVSDGLCKMLGYTMGEFHELVGNKYSIVIAEEDRSIFRKFVRELAKEEGIQTCEYRMICKDGSLLSVSDTMESKRNADGVMYGYSAVTNLSEYKKKQREIEMELSKTKEELMEARIKNANSQMQPHFLYNALASIREIVLEDPEYASNLIFDFSTHLRACIRSMSNDNLVCFSQELENIKAYINIEQMRFGNKLKVVYDIQEDQFEIIPLGLQPLVENAVRHGIYERGRAGGTVYIKTYAEDENWVVQIADDGVGFDVKEIWSQIENGKRDSTGLQNLMLRFEKKMNAAVDIRSEVGTGTKVTIYIPKGVKNESDYRR